MNIDQDRHMLIVYDNVGNQFRQNAVQNVGHLVGQNAVQNQGIQNIRNQNGLSVVPGIANQHRNENVIAAQAECNSNGINGNPIRCYNRQREGIQLNSEEFDFMAAAGAYDEIEEVNENCTLKDNLQQASTSGTQTDNALVYDSDGSAEVHHSEKCYDNDKFNMFTQEEQHTELLEPIPEPHQVQQNDSNVNFKVSNLEQGWGTVEQHPATVEETHAYFESLYNNLAIEVEKVNTKMALGYQNPFYLKQAQQKQQSLYNGKVILEKHDPPAMYGLEETLQLAQ
uniref:Uncharacterized protein n=1 Tax=Tanacetum cinerariifolium TaxID=118510 RepID=A0A699I3H5_TANCI|nr:hypothetical protein [Tanacetum cinerariifolium]